MQVDIDNPEFQGMIAKLRKQLGQPAIDRVRDRYITDLSDSSSAFYAGMVSALIHCLDVEMNTPTEDESRARHYGAMIVALADKLGQSQN